MDANLLVFNFFYAWTRRGKMSGHTAIVNAREVKAQIISVSNTVVTPAVKSWSDSQDSKRSRKKTMPLL